MHTDNHHERIINLSLNFRGSSKLWSMWYTIRTQKVLPKHSFSTNRDGPSTTRTITQRQNDTVQYKYSCDSNNDQIRVHRLGSTGVLGGIAAFKQFFNTTFLPAGYPDTVGPSYLRFIEYQALHHVASSVNGVLASTFLLYGVGLGASAAPVAGAMNWVLKDGLGQIGTLMFGKLIAHRFDLNAKTWYLSASLMLNAGVYLELLTFSAQHHFLFLASFANGIKGLAWMAGGSTRSAFNVSFARTNNIADITAKATAQTITASLIGHVIGVGICSQIGQSLEYAMGTCLIVSGVHLWSAYQCVRGIPLSTLNPSRLQLLTDRFLKSNSKYSLIKENSTKSLPTPTDLCEEDPAVHFPRFLRDSRFLPTVSVGVDVMDLCGRSNTELNRLLAVYSGMPYIVSVCDKDKSVGLVFREDATPKDCLCGYLNACILRDEYRHNVYPAQTSSDTTTARLYDSIVKTRELQDDFISQLGHSGWRCSGLQIEINTNRARW
eukprot:CFRG8244T1